MWAVLVIGFTVISSCSTEQLESLLVADLPSQPAVDTRVIGGTEASIEEYPYAVQILVNSRSLTCGGTLLTRRHVLSAAHCFVSQNNSVQNPQIFSVRAGTNALNTGGSLHAVSTIIVHENYNNPLRDNDVAILVLATAVVYSLKVAPASVPRQGAVVTDNATVIHIGWGRTDVYVMSASPTLQQVAVRKVSRSVCQERYLYLQKETGEPFPVTDSMICAGVIDVGGKDACQGDSGGPLVLGGAGVVVGVTSWGWGCAEPRFPGVSARVASYSDWINATVTRFNNASLVKASILSVVILISFLIII